LTKEQIDTYRRDGFVAHRNFLNPDEVIELKSEVLKTIAEMGRLKIAGLDKIWEIYSRSIRPWRKLTQFPFPCNQATVVSIMV
jgi:hypothetical protein